MGFADGVKASVEKVQQQVNSRITQQAEQLFRGIVSYSPVNLEFHASKRGELINNWWYGEGAGNYNLTHSSAFDASGTSSYNEAAKARNSTEFLGKDGEISFTNSTPYIMLAEYSGWQPPKWSGRVGPYAMVRKALNDNTAQYKDK